MVVFSEIAQKFIQKGLIAGLEWDIRLKSKELSSGVAGFRDIESKDALESNQLYRIYY